MRTINETSLGRYFYFLFCDDLFRSSLFNRFDNLLLNLFRSRLLYARERFIALQVEHACATELAAHLLGGLLTDEVELGAAHLGTLHYLDRIDGWRVEGEDLLDAYSGHCRPHREGGTGLLPVLDREHQALEGLLAAVLGGLLLLVGTAPLLELNDILDDTHGIARAYPERGAALHIYWTHNPLHDPRTLARSLVPSKSFECARESPKSRQQVGGYGCNDFLSAIRRERQF